MRSISEVIKGRDVATVEVPEWVLTRLGNPKTIRWRLQGDKITVECARVEAKDEFSAEVRESRSIKTLLKMVNERNRTFTQLLDDSKLNKRTLLRILKICKESGWIDKKGRNSPYFITDAGLYYLETSKTKPVESFQLDIVGSRTGGGSLIFRVPKHFMTQFSRLLHPEPIEGLRKIWQVAFEFWINRYGSDVVSAGGAKTAKLLAFGRDFNKDGIWDLVMCETPVGYPRIREFVRTRPPKPLVLMAYDALERELGRQELSGFRDRSKDGK